LRELAAEGGYSVAQLAVSWVLQNEGVIVGARRKGQIKETAKAADWILNEDVLNRVESAYQCFKMSIED